MGNRSRGRAASALIACVAFSPACARAMARPASDEASIERPAVGPPAGEGTALANLMPGEWDLRDIAQAGDASQNGSPVTPEDATAGPMVEPMTGPEPGTLLTDDASSPARGGDPALPLTPSGHVRRDQASHRGFFRQAGTVGPELALLAAYVGAQAIPKLFRPTTSFHFKDEGWFGKDTTNVGVDKLTHAFNTYLIAELLHYRLHRHTNGSEGDALTAGILAAGLMALNEVSDAIEPDSGYSMQDVAMNVAGAAFSVLRNTVPGLKEKLAFKLEILPNDQIYSHVGKKHYAQQRFMFSLKGAGFPALERSAMRYVDIQVGYYASNFLNSDRARGVIPKRHLFVGVGLNVGELLFAGSRSRIGRAAYSVLDYLQPPYTSLRYDTTGRLGN